MEQHSQEIDPYKHRQLIFNKEAKSKNSPSNSAKTTDIHVKKKLGKTLKPFIKINSKYIIELEAKHNNIRLLEDSIAENLDDIEFGDDSFGYNTKSMIHEKKNDKS